jgi:multicomponent Na+:H+ antiporter subunit C
VNQTILYAVTGVILFSLGLRSFILYGHLLRKILAFNIMGSGIFLLLVSIAVRSSSAPDPVPHAMVLTGIVVSVSLTAFALVLIRRIYAKSGRRQVTLDEPE